LVLACVLVGSSLALVGELVASLPGQPGRLPLNAVLSLLGIPVIAGILLGLGGQET
jgi:ABC-type Fe3+-siderophore transport system permease subunit